MLDNCDKSAISSPTNPRPQVDKQDLMASSGRVMEKPALQEQALKCPRCDSSNTKFCYYNNYSLSQPRHFCKACKRYWTRGGTLRNVPVGGGYRKNKKVKKSGGGGGGASSDSSSSISSFTHTPLSHQVDGSSSSAMSHINQLIYGLPNNPSFANYPFQRFNSRNSTGETMPIAYNPYNHQSQLSGLGLSFPSSSMTRDEHDYGTGYTHNSHIQDLLASSNSVLSNLSLLGSSNSTYGTNASIIPASFQKQKQVWNGFKESSGITRPNNNFQGLLPFENLQMGVGNGENDGTMAMNMVKMEERKDYNANRMEWRVPSDNHIEQNGNSDSSIYWNSSSLGGWPDLTNYGSSITPLI